MYIVYLKDSTAVATAICKDIETAKEQFTMYDDVQKITAADFNNMPIPAKLVNGEWVKADKVPHIDYPQDTTPESEQGTGNNSVYDELAAAYKEGVQEA